MSDTRKLVVSHPPHWHDGTNLSAKNTHILLAALPAVLMGIYRYGAPALGVVAFCVSWAVIWELLLTRVMGRSTTITDGSAAVTGLLMAMLMPPSMPWWAVVTGTFVAVVVGKMIYGGIGANPFNPVLVGIAILAVSWKELLDFDTALIHYDLGVAAAYPLASLKHFGLDSVSKVGAWDLLMARQTGGIGSIFGLGLLLGGVYLILRGYIRWEICVSFLAGVWVTALAFKISASGVYAGPLFHLFTGYTLIGAFFLATEDSSSPVHFIPMLIYGAGAGFLTVLIRNIGAYVDGVVFAILLMNLAHPLVDMLRPKALGKVEDNA